MNTSKRFSVILVALLTWQSLSPALAQTRSPVPSEDPFRRRVRAFGPGAEVRLVLESGKKLQGTIGALEDSEFELIAGKNKRTRIAYRSLWLLEMKRAVFTDAASRREAVRSVIGELGERQVFRLKLVSGDKIKGRIQDAQEGGFLLVPDKKKQSELISYDDVVEVRPAAVPNSNSGMHPLKKFAIGFGIIMALIFAGSRSPGGLP